jgi:hypothetical protein
VSASPPLLDRFIPHPEVRERFETSVHAPANLVMEVASNFDMQSLPIVKAIFWLREMVMGGGTSEPREPQGILEETKALGWGVLAEQPGRFVVCGAKCEPWLANVKFSPVASSDFESYAEPGQVKIAWTLEAEALGPAITRFAQETRAVATDEDARTKFRRYWRWARFGIISIRLLMLPAVRRAAERRWAVERDRK